MRVKAEEYILPLVAEFIKRYVPTSPSYANALGAKVGQDVRLGKSVFFVGGGGIHQNVAAGAFTAQLVKDGWLKGTATLNKGAGNVWAEFVFAREGKSPERYILDVAQGRVGYLKDFEPTIQAKYVGTNRALNP